VLRPVTAWRVRCSDRRHCYGQPDPVALSPSSAGLRLAAPGERYNLGMENAVVTSRSRLPRFRRASEPPAFRLTDDDVTIVRQLARHRFLRSTHIAALIGRSLDRTNDRLAKLFHAGYLDRPRAQLDYYPTSGSAPIAYALADRGARLLAERYGVAFANLGWSRKNREAGRPFIEHQLGVTDFYISLQLAARERPDLHVIHADELIAAFPEPPTAWRNPFSMKVKVSQRGIVRERGLVPDFTFGLVLPNRDRRHFMVEIDRGTMPVVRHNPMQTSFEQKMRAYLTANAAGQHERFGWKSFRVLTVTTDLHRTQSMMEALRALRVPHSPGSGLFLFAAADELRMSDPISYTWRDGNGRDARLI
jgi:Replication-relaxation